jgi:hypothetical protein
LDDDVTTDQADEGGDEFEYAPPPADQPAPTIDNRALLDMLEAQRAQIQALTSTLAAQRPERDAALVSQQLQDMQQFIQLQKAQMEQQKREIDQLRLETFRSEPPALPYQVNVPSTPAAISIPPTPPPLTRSDSYYYDPPPATPFNASLPPHSEPPVATPALNTHARLGLTADFPSQTKKQQNHLTELRLGSRYIVRGSNGLA